jgi:sec-independent protein translocase protein TatA
MFGLGWTEVVLILLAVVLIFGPKKLPEIGAALGKTLRGFKEEIRPDAQAPDENDR